MHLKYFIIFFKQMEIQYKGTRLRSTQMKASANRNWKDTFQHNEEKRREERLPFSVTERQERVKAEHCEAARNYFRDTYSHKTPNSTNQLEKSALS